ncbi:methyltransferase domain-containing protein [Kitasatospora sp. A2-31]|uniref:methyltransferase domain-containing protein n=1 Tax=Kitasatospora sp. A2-31 TaxID=2916414 RepID=UPI001EEB0B0C|nr:methyltransferase domain-containing protein [Kitasatospora sp. A2-31]MCG6494744.1 methyltransferase domain-containing protein [Kitasatospora sp. A2-31]
MIEQHEAEAGRARLASALIANGSLTSDWLPGYAAVPRHLFVPDTVWPGRADGVRQGEAVNRDADRAAWWEAVHSDVPLTTQWDDGAHAGTGRGTIPTSSSSMPTMVFSMLAALNVEDGNRVLEIGTGTGWNAALLAHRLGPGNVVTVEVDHYSAAAARQRLAKAGYAPTSVVGDGADGYAKGAPYDRVIATCSVGRIPQAWVEQARPGGVIVVPWGPEYGGEAVVRLTVGDDGTASGRFIGSSAFMRLRQQRAERPDSLVYLSGPWPADGARSSTPLSPEDVGGWLEMFVIGVQVPGAFPLIERYQDGAYTLWLHDTAVTSWATVDWEPDRGDYEVVQSGRRRLWDEVDAAWRWWDARGRPGFDRFGLTVAGASHSVWLDSPDNPVALSG